MNRAHTLEEIVEAGWAPSVLYLQRLLQRKAIKGRKVGRDWRLSDSDFESYLEWAANTADRQVVEVPRIGGLTAASARRRAS